MYRLANRLTGTTAITGGRRLTRRTGYYVVLYARASRDCKILGPWHVTVNQRGILLVLMMLRNRSFKEKRKVSESVNRHNEVHTFLAWAYRRFLE